jgi:hypothetical protein
MNFKVGDRVIIGGYSPAIRGKKGTIVSINETTLSAFVELDCGEKLLIPARFLIKDEGTVFTVFNIIEKRLGIDACELEYECLITCELVNKWHKKLTSCSSREEYAQIVNGVDKDLTKFNLTWGQFIQAMTNKIELEKEIKKWNQK